MWIERIDGSETDFSYIKCFVRKSDKVKITQHELDVKKSARNAIHKYMKKLKIERNQYGDAHHSNITFDQLFDNWTLENNIDIEKIEVGGHRDGEEEIYFVDKDIEKSFIEYHNDHASIEVLSPYYHRHLKKS